MHSMQRGGSQSPEGQTGAETRARRSSDRLAFFLFASGGYPCAVTQSNPAGPARPCPGTDSPGPLTRRREQSKPSTKREYPLAHGIASESCWRPASTSATRRAAGTPRCAASSSASAAASTSSTCRRPSVCCTTPRSSPPRSPAAAAPCCSWAPRSRRATPSRRPPTACGMPYVHQRWLGGLLTNFQTDLQAHQAPARAARLDRERHAGAAPTRERIAARTSATSSRSTWAACATCSARPTRSSWSTSRPRRSPCARHSG